MLSGNRHGTPNVATQSFHLEGIETEDEEEEEEEWGTAAGAGHGGEVSEQCAETDSVPDASVMLIYLSCEMSVEFVSMLGLFLFCFFLVLFES